jgi:DNA (cytosine-5)-methyltransferase 1
MKLLSLFSGIGGFDLALERTGMICDSMVEIDKNCQNVLRRHFPNSKLYDDVKEVGNATHERKSIDLICGGFPCQDLSIAGKRAGLAGERSGLWYEFARIIDELEPQWVVAENVPGLLSSDKGADFEIIVRWLAERGYGVAWRILDAQYFGVPQRRHRVFVVGSLGDGRAAEVLFESEGMSGNTPSKQEAGEIAPTLFANGAGTSRVASAGSESEFCIPIIAPTVLAVDGAKWGSNQWIDNQKMILQRSDGALQARDEKGIGSTIDDKLIAFTPRRTNINPMKNIFPTQNTGNGGFGANAIAWVERGYNPNGGEGVLESDDLSFCLDNFRVPRVGVRRLTPIECERLQGFPEIQETIIIDVCLDHQNNSASVEIKNRKPLKPAGNAERKGKLENAKFVEMNLGSKNQRIKEHALPSVLINCGERKAEIHNQGRSCLSVNFAESRNSFPPLTQDEDFALLLAGASSILAQITMLGAEELHQSVPNSTLQKDGQSVVRLSGNETMQLVNGAGKDLTIANGLLKSIISNPFSLKISDMTLTTLFSCVLAAISGYIPSETLKSNSFQVEINTSFGWTFGQSDSVRYRQLGNAVAVPVVEWIGKRIYDTTSNLERR